MNLLDLIVSISAKDNASSQIEGLSSKSIAMGSAMGTTLGNLVADGIQKAAGAIVDFGKDTINTGMEFDSAMSQVAATMGVTTDDIQDLTNFAKEMGSTTAFSATEAADALNYMALAGYDSETSMKMLPNVLNLAAAGGMDLATASDMVTDSQTALGLSLEETNTLVDQMAQTASSSNTSVAQLGDAILTVGGTAKNLSGGMGEMNTVLGVLADNGIKGSEAGTHLRNMILSLSAPTDTAAKAMEELGVSATDAEGNMRPLEDVMGDFNVAFADMTAEEKTQALSKIFNKTDLASVNALLDTSTDRWEELGSKIEGAGVSASSFAEQFTKAGGDLDSTKAKLEKLGIATDAFDSALATSNGSAELFVAGLHEAADSGVSLDDVISTMGMSMDELQGAFDGTKSAAEAMAATQLDNLEGDMTLLQSATEGVQLELANGVTPSLRNMVQTGSEGLSQMASQLQSGDLLGGFVTLGETASKVAESFMSALPEFVDAGMKMIFGFLQGLGQGLPQLIPTIVQSIVGMAQAIIANVPTIIQAAVSLVQGLVQGIVQAIPVLVGMIPELITTIINAAIQSLPILIQGAIDLVMGVVQALPDIIDALIQAIPQIITAIVQGLIQWNIALIEGFIQLFTAVVENLPLIISVLIELVPQIIESLANGFIDAAPQIIAAFQEMFSKLPDKAQEFFSGVLQNAAQWIKDMASKAGEAGKQFLDNVVKFIQELPGKISNFCSNIINNIRQWASDMVEKARSLGSSFLNKVVEFVSQLPGKFREWISNILNNVRNWASDMVEKAKEAGKDFLEKTKSKFGEVVDFFKNLPRNILNAIGDLSRLLWSAGQDIIWGLIDGIGSMVNNAINAITDCLGWVVDGALSFLGINSPSKVFAEIGDYSMQGLAKGFEKGSESAADTLDGILDDMSNSSVSVGVKGSLPGKASKDQEFVFNVTINTDTDAIDYGRKIGESLYETMKRRELNYA